MVEPPMFDVFLAHNSVDKPQVRAIARELKRRGLKPWLDEEQILGGDSIPSKVEEGLTQSPVAALFIGTSGFGKFQKIWELDALIMMCSEQNVRIIPILLPGADTLPALLKGKKYLQFCQSVDEIEPLEELVQATTVTLQSLILIKEVEPEEDKEATIKPSFPSLHMFEFDVHTLEIEEVQRSGLFKQGYEVKINISHNQSQYFREVLSIDVTLDMVAIPGGKFLMGTEDKEIERLCKKFNWEGFTTEKPQHEVTLQPFFMGKYPVTQKQWRAIASREDLKVERDLALNPAKFSGLKNFFLPSDQYPVEQVSWYDAVEFCQRLSKQTGKEYRLPSEAEWEYACRAGTTTPFNFGVTNMNQANYDRTKAYGSESPGDMHSASHGPSRVDRFDPNAFGLYDMHGNVYEWCEDDWHKNYQDAPTDGSAWLSRGSILKSVRGGSWYDYPVYIRSAFRDAYTCDTHKNNIGFRVVCVAPRTT